MGVASKLLTEQQLKDALMKAAQDMPQAWEQLFTQLQQVVTSQVRHHLARLPHQEQADSVQQVLEYLWKDRAWVMAYEPARAPLPYVTQIIRRSVYRCNRETMTLKRQNIQVVKDPERAPELPTDKTQQELNNAEALKVVCQFMNGLKPEERLLWQLRWLDEEPSRVVAEQLDITEANVNTRFSRLKKEFEAFAKKVSLLGVVFVLSLQLLWGLEPRGLEPRGLEPRGLEPRGLEPRGLEPRGLEGRWAQLQRYLPLTVSLKKGL